MAKTINNVLIALMNNASDFKIVKENGWYRIPVKSAPTNIKDNSARIIAFYHTKEFKKEKYSIKWYGEIKRTLIVKREQLFPSEAINSKSGKEYFKIEIGALKELSIPIISMRPRRILFIPTTSEKFFSVKEVNFLFNNSCLENIFWNALLIKNILAERQYYVKVEKKSFYLDFALFCKGRNINIEIDGDAFHMKENAVRKDKSRNNLLESIGWSVLRFTSKDIKYNLQNSIDLVLETANNYGGIQNPFDPSLYTYLSHKNEQLTFFS